MLTWKAQARGDSERKNPLIMNKGKKKEELEAWNKRVRILCLMWLKMTASPTAQRIGVFYNFSAERRPHGFQTGDFILSSVCGGGNGWKKVANKCILRSWSKLLTHKTVVQPCIHILLFFSQYKDYWMWHSSRQICFQSCNSLSCGLFVTKTTCDQNVLRLCTACIYVQPCVLLLLHLTPQNKQWNCFCQ